MNNYLTEDTKATLLLCVGAFDKGRSATPLSLNDYRKLADWLNETDRRPGDLLRQENIAEASQGSGIDPVRLETLLGRGVQMGFAVEEWQRYGIWIISESDEEEYPERYKKNLEYKTSQSKNKTPPLLFGIGDQSLLSGGGLGIVGSRNIDQTAENFTRKIAELCASNNMPVVSGAARGVDRIAMGASLESGGTVVGILADSLLKQSLANDTRHAIAEGHLLLLSPYEPKAHFDVWRAMERNKLIYSMADYVMVVSADHRKGGTWAGAEQELKKRVKPQPVFVRDGNNVPLGNRALLKDLGAIPWRNQVDDDDFDFKQHIEDLVAKNQASRNNPDQGSPKEYHQAPLTATSTEPRQVIQGHSDPVYRAVLPIILRKLNELNAPATLGDLAESLGVYPAQLKYWLKKATADGTLIKQLGPERYQIKRQHRLELQAPSPQQMVQEHTPQYPSSIYREALPFILDKLNTPATLGRLFELFKPQNITWKQLKGWLGQAVDDGKLTKNNRGLYTHG